MARITVEDCIDKFPSRFELVLVASNRARKLYSGENPTVEKDNDKNTVIALREIAQETLTLDQLKNDLVEEYQTLTLNEDEEIIDEDVENEEETSNEESSESDKILNNLSDIKDLADEKNPEIENEKIESSSDGINIEPASEDNVENIENNSIDKEESI
tara:strand:- start:73 stop:549 length:477 start_codon:yes stop_codon:yes gene_type:complete